MGCGPCVHSAATLSAVFDEIYLAEIRVDGRELVEKWLRNDKGAFDWKPVLKIIAQEEGKYIFENCSYMQTLQNVQMLASKNCEEITQQEMIKLRQTDFTYVSTPRFYRLNP